MELRRCSVAQSSCDGSIVQPLALRILTSTYLDAEGFRSDLQQAVDLTSDVGLVLPCLLDASSYLMLELLDVG